MQPDHNDALKVEQRLRAATNELHKLAEPVAMARQVKEFSSERRKALLAQFTVPLLIGNSSAAAEAMARANPEYLAGLTALEEQYRTSENMIAKWQATICTFDAARSLMSMSKEQLRQI